MTSLSRVVRIFISSTFRDFAGERDILVRKIFSELRRRCRERQVELVDVDLRWGITEAEAQQGKVLPICLAEIDRSRPYFIGLLGERYGWVPEAQRYNASLVQEQPWLSEHAGGKSVTELEVLHGVLNNPAMAGHALFYFRNPTYSQERGGNYAAESPEHRDKLTQLKGRIRQSGFPVVEDYPDPEALAQRVQEDLWKLIDATYPLNEVPDALALERRRHESYGQSRLGLYLGGDNYLASLDTFIREDQRAVLIRGESGGGKSALVANWLQQFRQAQPKAQVFVHHLGSTNDAGEPTKLVRRWIQELARVLGEEAKLPGEPDKLYEELPQWLAKASAHAQQHGTRWVIVLDALDKLREGRDLRWLPSFLPAGVQLIASCLTGDVLTAAQRRLRWEQEIEVRPLEKSDQQHLIRKYLGKYSKRLTSTQEQTVLAHPLTVNPLFLLTLLYEFRVHGKYETLEKRIRTLLSPPASKGAGEAPTVDDVFEHVLERVEADTVTQHVRASMEAIWASRAGLAQDELLAIANVAPVQWAAVQLGLDEMLLESGGRWTFAHDFGRKAVQDRYGLVSEAKVQAHRTLAEYFAKQEPKARVAEELPWQWEQAGEKERLKDCLTDREQFAAIKERDEYELLGYWLWLGADISAEYEAAWQQWAMDGEEVASVGWDLAAFLNTAGYYTVFALGMGEEVLRLRREKLGADHPDTLSAMNSLAISYSDTGRLEEALGMREEVLRLRREKLGADHPDTLSAMNNLANSYSNTGRLEEALGMFEEVLRLRREKLGADHPHTLSAMNNLAVSYRQAGRLEEALGMGEEVLRLRREKLGADHPDTLTAMNNLAISYWDTGRLEEALVMGEEVLRLMREKLGADHPDTLMAMNNLAVSYSDTGRFEEALVMREEVLRLSREKLGADHPDTLMAMNNLAISYRQAGRLEEALGMREEVLRLSREKLGADHPDTLSSMGNLAVSYSDTGRFEEALGMGEEVLRLMREKLGADHPDTLTAMHNLASSYSNTGRLEEAMGMEEEVLRLRREKLGPDHPDTLTAMNNLAISYSNTGRLEEALGMFEEVLRLRREKLGADHPDTLSAMGNLAFYYSDAGRLEEAMVMREEVLRLMREKLGADHPDTLTAMHNLARSYRQADRPEEALGMEEEVLRLKRDKLGADHPDTLSAMNNLAISYSDTGRLEEALGMEEEVLRLRRDKLGADHSDTLDALHNLASSYRQAGRLEEALGMFEEVLRLRREKLGADHPHTLGAMHRLAYTLNALGRLPDALSLLRKASAESPVVHTGVRYHLACYECLSGNLEEAKQLITEEIAADPEKKEHALQDSDLTAIHDFIQTR